MIILESLALSVLSATISFTSVTTGCYKLYSIPVFVFPEAMS
jgi:hypothetical protein